MSLKANYEFLFAGKDDNSFLENYSYDLFQDHGEKSGQIFVNLEIQNNPVDAEEIGAVLFETMQKVFFEEMERDPYERFEIALKAVNSVLAEFKAQKVSGYIGNLNVAIVAIVGDTLYLTQTGDAEIYLIRKRYVSVVSDGLSEENGDSGDVFTNIASGDVEVGDFVLLSSTRLLRYISKTDFAKCVASGDVAETLNEIKDVISTEMLGRVGLTGIVSEEGADVLDLEELDEGGDVESDVETEAGAETKTFLESSYSRESSDSHVPAKKRTVAGKFATALKGLKSRRKSEVFKGRSRGGSSLSELGGKISGGVRGLFSGGSGKNKVLALLVVVIIVLTLGVIITKGNMADRDEIARVESILVTVQEKLAEAETKGVYDKEAAKEILDKAYDDTVSVLNSGYSRDKARLYLEQINEVRDKLDDVQRVEAPTVLADLSAKREDVNALGFAVVGDRVFVYEYNALYELVLDQVQDPLTIDDEETVIAATGFDDRNSVVFLTKSGKLIEYKNGTMSFMDTDDGTFRKAVAIADWSNNVYLLDSTGSQIWKYSYKGTREKFGGAEEYFSEDVDISAAVDLAIDSSVYVLQNTGDIFKFYGGTKAEFYINNAPFNVFKSPKAIFTNEKLDDIFVLDSSEGRVLVFTKDPQSGNVIYKSQYLFDGNSDLRDIYVDPDSNKLYVLTSSKVLEVEL